jgi:hypothetical protein
VVCGHRGGPDGCAVGEGHAPLEVARQWEVPTGLTFSSFFLYFLSLFLAVLVLTGGGGAIARWGEMVGWGGAMRGEDQW